jgi:GH24 family phage-related lysozyme (muramidase)
MAKLKSKLASKYTTKRKRKFVDGGPYTDVEKELYLNDNVTYQASTPPTAMLQNQFDAQEQEKAKRMTAIYGDQMARQLDYLQDQTAASEKRKQEEKAQQTAVAEANTQQVKNTANKNLGVALTAGVQAAKTGFQIQQATNAAMAAAKPVTYSSNIGSWAASGASSPVVQSAAKSGLQAGAKAVGGAALIAAPEIAGTIISNQLNKADDKQMKRENRSQYYDDTEYSRKEYNAQLTKSTGRGATIGGTIGSAIPIPGVGTGLGMAIGAAVGLGVGAIKAQHQRRMTKTEDERGFKIGNKKFGKKLLFGEENVYDENLDPAVVEKRNREAQLKAMTQTANAMDNATLSSMTQYDANTGFNVAKYGGAIKKLKGGIAIPIGKNAVKLLGNSHEKGGMVDPKEPNIEYEGDETIHDDKYVFSATLKLPNGETYAQAHERLIKSGATGEEIQQLALTQEAAAGRNPNEVKGMKFAKYGGPLKYVNGGKKEDNPNLDEMTLLRIHASEGVGPNGLTTPYVDSKGYWTVGHGHLLVDSKGNAYTKSNYPTLNSLPANVRNVTKQQVETWAKTDYENSKKIAQDWIGKDTWEALPDSVKSGTIELAYGLGPNKLKDFNETKEAIVTGDYERAGEQIYRTGYYKDVKERRGNLVAALVGGNDEVLYNAAKSDQYTVPLEFVKPFAERGVQGVKYNTNLSYTPTQKKEGQVTTNVDGTQRKIVQIPGAYGSMVDAYWDPQSSGYVMTEQSKKAQEDFVRIKQEQDADILNWGMGALTGIYGGTKALVTGAAKKAGQYIDDVMSEEEAASNAGQNVGGARASGANTGVTRSTGIPYRNQDINTNLANFKPFGQETGLATEGQWMADAGAISDEALGFPRPSGNMGVGPYRPENGYINITGRTIKPTVDPRVKLNFGDLAKVPLGTYFNSEKFTEKLEEEKKKAKEKPEEVIVPEEEKTTEETTGTGTADTSGLQDKYKLPKISAGPFNRPEYPTRTAEETTPPKEKYDLSELPADKKDYTGLLNFVPGIVAGMTPNFKTVAPSLVQGSTGSPGAIGRVTFNRETDRQLLAENARTAAAMQQAAGMQGGPGALAALGRAQLLKSEADLKATGMVQAKNAEINAREAAANASISAQNIANANQYEARRLQQAAMNANILNTTNQYNTDLKNKEKYMKYATGVEVAQNAVENYLGYKKDQDTLQRDKDVASAMDAYHTLERKDIERKILEASTDKKSKYYGTDPVTARAMARQYIEEAYPDQRKLGGPKYVSRLGNLVNKRNKRF